MELTEEKMKEIKKHSRFCAFCRGESLFDACTVQMVSITESGKIETPYRTKGSSMSAMLPLCAYHMILAQEGIIAVTTKGRPISAGWLMQFETLSDAALLIKSKLKRSPKITKQAHFAKAIFQARKFQSEMDAAKGKSPEELIKEFKDKK